MLGYTLKRRLTRKNINKLLTFYKKYIIFDLIVLDTKTFSLFFSISSPNRQHFFLLNTKEFYKTHSAGVIQAKSNIQQKYYKKTVKINSTLILYLQSIYKEYLKYVLCFYMKNLTLRHWVFLQKYLLLVSPVFKFLIYKHSYNVNTQPQRRIKRRILRNLKKQG